MKENVLVDIRSYFDMEWSLTTFEKCLGIAQTSVMINTHIKLLRKLKALNEITRHVDM